MVEERDGHPIGLQHESHTFRYISNFLSNTKVLTEKVKATISKVVCCTLYVEPDRFTT